MSREDEYLIEVQGENFMVKRDESSGWLVFGPVPFAPEHGSGFAQPRYARKIDSGDSESAIARAREMVLREFLGKD